MLHLISMSVYATTSSTGILCNLVLVRKIYAEEVIEEVIRSERN